MEIQIPKIQAVFFDIDGTLVSFKTHAVYPTTKAAIRQLRDNGIKVIISTGRSINDLINMEDLVFDGFITANGAYCVDSDGEVIAQHQISKESLDKLALYWNDKPFPCSFMTDKGNFVNYIDELMMSFSTLVKIPIPTVKPVSEILQHTVYQLDAFIDSGLETVILTHLLTDCVGYRWHPLFVDINAKECSKATGIDCFLKHFGIPIEHSMAFGDGANDISMLKRAAIGVAMGNAQDHVKAAADYTTTSVDEDGVVNALKHFKVIS